MGKWSNAQYDGILSSKMKTLVSGAIERSRLEKTHPMIKYKDFVTNLDAGDSFTTSIIDILVQELAGRISRQEQKDKGFIADKTSQNLRRLAAPYRVYRANSSTRAHRRSVNLTDYLHGPPGGAMDAEEDSDSFEWVDTTRLALPDTEGVHSSSSQVYESLTPWINPNMATHMREGSPDPTFQPISAVPRPLAHGSWVSAPSGSLPAPTRRRAPSFRRPLNTRATDFTDFTSRRRSTAREVQSSPIEQSQDAEAAAGDSFHNRESSLPTVRRFFSLGGSRLRNPSQASPPPSVFEPGIPLTSSPQQSRAELGQSPSPPPRNISPFSDPLPPLPRLRRGGLRAPESMLFRSASPVGPIHPSERASVPPELAVPPPAEYPTPTSIDNE